MVLSALHGCPLLKYLAKYHPEITIKSRPVRQRYVRRLEGNLRAVLSAVDAGATVCADWEKLIVASSGAATQEAVADALARTPGIGQFLEAEEHPFLGLDDALERVLACYGEDLAGKTFSVRCKRSGQHAFRSPDVERHLGAGLLQRSAAAGVDLERPQVRVQLEIRQDRLYLTRNRREGLGGFPIGVHAPALSLISGGFDSAVASYQVLSRGVPVHFCFFNLGGREHERGVRDICRHLWARYAASAPLRFVSVPFGEVLDALLRDVRPSLQGVALKRAMLRAACQVAERYGIRALVTGESVGQVASQTMVNLGVIDEACDRLVLRPLIAAHKPEILAQAKALGVFEMCAAVPEYCGLLSRRPSTGARLQDLRRFEAVLPEGLVEHAVSMARMTPASEPWPGDEPVPEVETLSAPLADSVIIDLRPPEACAAKPLRHCGTATVLPIPFYELDSKRDALDKDRHYLLYCEQGMISRAHATRLFAAGYDKVKVYRPAAPRLPAAC